MLNKIWRKIPTWFGMGMITLVFIVLSAIQQFNPSTSQNSIIPPILRSESKQQTIKWSDIGTGKYTPSHKEVIWVSVLHWCESRGEITAINPKDLDNTPSYGSYQFKPETLKGYAVRYGLLPDNLEREDYINWSFDYELTTEIVYRMLNDDSVKWKKEFPDCATKHGMPPKQPK